MLEAKIAELTQSVVTLNETVRTLDLAIQNLAFQLHEVPNTPAANDPIQEDPIQEDPIHEDPTPDIADSPVELDEPDCSPDIELDKRGFPWDERIHASTKAKNADGTWRARKNVDKALVSEVEAELSSPTCAQPTVDEPEDDPDFDTDAMFDFEPEPEPEEAVATVDDVRAALGRTNARLVKAGWGEKDIRDAVYKLFQARNACRIPELKESDYAPLIKDLDAIKA